MSFIPLKSLKFPGIDDIYVNNPLSIAGQFSNIEQYSIGNLVYYNGDLYKFTSAHSPGVWNANEAIQVTVADVLGDNDVVNAKTEAVQAASNASASATAAAESALQAAGSASGAEETAESISASAAQIETNKNDITDLKADLTQIENATVTRVVSKNLLNPDTVTTGRLASNGTIQTNMTAYFTSDYILLEGGKTYVLARESLTTPGGTGLMGYSGYGFYDLSKVWIANSRVYDNYGSVVLTITPESDCYIRVTGTRTYLDSDTKSRYILQEGTALDGYEAYFDPYYKPKGLQAEDIVQTSGQNTDKVMSQKAVTDYTKTYVAENVNLDEIAPYTIGKNKYNPDDCSPQNFVYYNTTGDVAAATSYAITGKIPVQSGKVYTFSATEFATQYMRPYYFGGETGETFISREEGSASTFTTPENCTFVAFNLFGRGHTDEDFEAAMAVAMLEEGSIATTYEPYIRKRVIGTDSIEGGDQIAAITEVTEKISIINLYDKSLAKDGKYYMRGVESSNADWAATGKIPVKPNRQYNLSVDPSSPMKLTSMIYTFDEAGTYLGTATLGNYVYRTLLSFSTGSDVRFIAAHMNAPGHTSHDFQDTFDTVMLCYGTARPLQYSSYNPVAVTIAEKNTDEYFNPDVFAGKRWLATGTSITWYDSKAYQAGLHEGELCRGYVGNVARRKALLVTNEGISGSTLANVSSSSLINRYQDLDWANADIATIEYGVNDFGHAVDIGTAYDAPGTDTFAACLKTVIEYALTQNPKLCLVICTEPDVRGNTQNAGGHYLKEFTDVTLEIARQYRLPVCDWYYHCGINSVTKGNSSVDLLTADGTHPNDAGHLRMGAMLNQVFDSLIC